MHFVVKYYWEYCASVCMSFCDVAIYLYFLPPSLPPSHPPPLSLSFRSLPFSLSSLPMSLGSLAFPTTTLMWLIWADVVANGYWVKRGVSPSFGTCSLLSRTTSSLAPQWNPRHNKPHPLNHKLHPPRPLYPKAYPQWNYHRIILVGISSVHVEHFSSLTRNDKPHPLCI